MIAGRGRETYDVAVVGAGHAGVEAALAAARIGARVALLTLDRSTIGQMSCNPAIGGLAKGHLVREIDALGGEMGRAIDATGIQFRMLNTRKGPAVWGPRAQADRELYNSRMVGIVEGQAGLDVIEGEAEEVLLAESGHARGLALLGGREVAAGAVILATGTFLGGRMFTGEEVCVGGRRGEPAATRLTASLRRLGLTVGRLKTGTPPRICQRDLDHEWLRPQPGDPEPRRFSHFAVGPADGTAALPQLDCWITRTTPETHEIVRANLHRSPLHSGAITGTGPRCTDSPTRRAT